MQLPAASLLQNCSIKRHLEKTFELWGPLLRARRHLPESCAGELGDGAERSLSCVQPKAKIAIRKMRKDVGRLMMRRVPTRAHLRSALDLAQAAQIIPNGPRTAGE